MNFTTPPENQGQIVTESYACDEEGIYCRTFDRSDNSETIEFASYDQWDEEPECDFWNGAPAPIDRGEWTEIKDPKTQKWIVGVGGSPKETWDEYASLDDAKDAAVEMAREMADEQGIDPDEIEIYEEDDRIGACPDGSTGAYWPVVERS